MHGDDVDVFAGGSEPAVEPVVSRRIDAGARVIEQRERDPVKAKLKVPAAEVLMEQVGVGAELVVAEGGEVRNSQAQQLALEALELLPGTALGEVARSK